VSAYGYGNLHDYEREVHSQYAHKVTTESRPVLMLHNGRLPNSIYVRDEYLSQGTNWLWELIATCVLRLQAKRRQLEWWSD
jgi:hypothetical protein